MAFQLCLILLATSVLAKIQRATLEGTTPPENPLREYFHWGTVGYDSVSLSWDKEGLEKVIDGEIRLMATATSDPELKASTFAYLRDGNVTLDGLAPNTSYTVTATVIYKKSPILEFGETIRTKEVDETLIREHFHWGPVTDHSIHLTWDVPPPDETMDAVIKVKAVVGSDPLTERSASAPFSKGELTLDGLKSDSLYTVTVMGIVDGHKYFEFNENIHTKESGHGGGSTAKASGLGILSAIVVLLFNCMAVVRA